uniref:Uncharacterized protein n=1 Tax=viral metagenome TaxID=1070528 RepID=A0A6C0AZH9_9ZZZZ
MVNKCIHNKQKRYCKECGGSGLCEHNRQKWQCIDCGTLCLCEHGKRIKYCKDCDGSLLCIHFREKKSCKECHGTCICEHNKLRHRCKDCKGSAICIHNKLKYSCKECKGSAICIHNKKKDSCNGCKGSAICKHNINKRYCKECDGSGYCIHNKIKTYCKICGGSCLCKSSWCETRSTKKYEHFCLFCFIHLFPEKEISRNYKTKEKVISNYITTNISEYSFTLDKRINDGCSLKRPDVFLDLGTHCIIIEIDENQHTFYNTTCENKRIMELSKDVNFRNIIFIRFNPDGYKKDDKKITSCWSVNKNNIYIIKKSKITEWNDRLKLLVQTIKYHIENTPEKLITIIELYYDS